MKEKRGEMFGFHCGHEEISILKRLAQKMNLES